MIPRMRVTTVLLAITLCAAVPLHAQHGVGIAGGSFGPRISYDYEYGDSGRGPGRHSWIRSVVMWRGQPGWGRRRVSDTAATHAAERAWRAEVGAAEESRRSIMGGVNGDVMYVAQVGDDGATLRVLGRTFAVPERDSILVVMVDRIDGVGGSPYVAGTTYVTTAPPPGFWPKIWQRGDTTFVVNPHDRNDMLAAELRKSPVIAEFLR